LYLRRWERFGRRLADGGILLRSSGAVELHVEECRSSWNYAFGFPALGGGRLATLLRAPTNKNWDRRLGHHCVLLPFHLDF